MYSLEQALAGDLSGNDKNVTMPYKCEANRSGSEGKFTADKGSRQKWVKVLLLLTEGAEIKKEREQGGKKRMLRKVRGYESLKFALVVKNT